MRFRFTKSLTLLIIAVSGMVGFLIGYSYGHIDVADGLNSSRFIVVSTTTSLYQLGVIDSFLNEFKDLTKLDVQFRVLVKGSGESLRLLADGSACIGFVHAPSLELQYIEQGKVERLAIFGYNEFVIVGPIDDPANVSNAIDAIDAFKKIYSAGEKGLAKFISRGDMSGTHVRELQLWNLTGLNPEGRAWYMRAGQGMAQTLIMADNIGAYTLTDIGSFLNLKNQGKINSLVILKKDFRYLVNVYSIYLSKASSCDNPFTWYVAYKLRDYVMSRGQELLNNTYRGFLNPVKGSEAMVEEAWRSLAKIG